MTQRVLAIAAALSAASLLAAGPALATCNGDHTVAKQETPVASTQQPAPKPAETATKDTKDTTVRTVEAKPAAR